MSKTRVTAAVLAAAVALAAGTALRAQGTAQKTKPAAPAPTHVMVTADELKWGPAPPGLPPGAQAAILYGDPGKAGPFVVRAKFPDGYRVPPHWHPTDENVSVLSGTLAMGMGDKVDEASMKALGAHGFAHTTKLTHHYVIAKGATEIQIHGTGPFAITYVNPNDDPRKKTTTPTTK